MTGTDCHKCLKSLFKSLRFMLPHHKRQHHPKTVKSCLFGQCKFLFNAVFVEGIIHPHLGIADCIGRHIVESASPWILPIPLPCFFGRPAGTLGCNAQADIDTLPSIGLLTIHRHDISACPQRRQCLSLNWKLFISRRPAGQLRSEYPIQINGGVFIIAGNQARGIEFFIRKRKRTTNPNLIALPLRTHHRSWGSGRAETRRGLFPC